ncbi:MAG: DUF1772 domain-containing protein [Thermoanaerobaculia bacterium]
MSTLVVVRFVALLSIGLLAGIFFGDRMGASFARPKLSPSSFVTFQQVQHVHFARMMPILVGIGALSSVAWLVLIRSRIGTGSFTFLALGTLAFISAAVLTRSVNLPINDQLMTWSATSPPADMMQIWARWEQVHTVRTILVVLAFACDLSAFGMSANDPTA